MNKRENNALRHFFIHKLGDIYNVQCCLKKELPKMVAAAFTMEVNAALEVHQHVTFRQIIRLNAIFDHLSLRPYRKPSPVIKRMVKEIKTQMKKADPVVLDTGLIIGWRGIDHYKIAAYAGLVGLATSLESTGVARSLFMSMEEEMDADTGLREITGDFYSHVLAEKQVVIS